MLDYICDMHASLRILDQQVGDEVTGILADSLRKLKLSGFNSYECVLDGGAFKRRGTSDQRVHYATKAPEVSLEPVGFVLDHLR